MFATGLVAASRLVKRRLDSSQASLVVQRLDVALARAGSRRAVDVTGFASAHAPRRAPRVREHLRERTRIEAVRSGARHGACAMRLRAVTSTARREVPMCAQSKSSSAALRLEHHARSMRRHPTPSEQVLWQAIRGRRLGAAFRRQVPLGPYIVDFLAARERLIVEVDGAYHALREGADRRRQRWLERQGFRVVRVSAELVLRDTAAAVRCVRAAL